MHTIKIIARYLVANNIGNFLNVLDRTADPVRIRGTKYSRYTIRGVSGRKADVIIAEAIEQHRVELNHAVLEISDQTPQNLTLAFDECVLEIGEKVGKYDDAVGRRYALRYFRAKNMVDIPHADFKIISHDDELLIIVLPADGSPKTIDTYKTFPQTSRLDDPEFDHDFGKIMRWQILDELHWGGEAR